MEVEEVTRFAGTTVADVIWIYKSYHIEFNRTKMQLAKPVTPLARTGSTSTTFSGFHERCTVRSAVDDS